MRRAGLSGLTLSSIVAVNGSPGWSGARRSGSSAGTAHAISKTGARVCWPGHKQIADEPPSSLRQRQAAYFCGVLCV